MTKSHTEGCIEQAPSSGTKAQVVTPELTLKSCMTTMPLHCGLDLNCTWLRSAPAGTSTKHHEKQVCKGHAMRNTTLNCHISRGPRNGPWEVLDIRLG
jgi:hypothetical protein